LKFIQEQKKGEHVQKKLEDRRFVMAERERSRICRREGRDEGSC